MALTLRVSSFQGPAMGANAVRVFQANGSIGRAPGNDWVLPDPERFVSSQHAVISFEGGAYFLTDRSTNGTIVNGQTIVNGNRVRLQTGDRLTIGNYDLVVAVDVGAAARPAAQATPDPFSFAAQPMAGRDSSVDPLDFFGPAPTPPRAPPGADHDHAPADSAFFAPPSVRPDPQPSPGASVIPENWDDTGFSARAPAAAEWAPPAAPAPSRPAPPPEASAEPAVAASPTVRGLHAAGAASAPESGADVHALLRAAGLDPASVDAAAMAELGEILRVVIDGVMDVLRARTAIKNQFRVAMTTLKPVENNPLKFSPSAEDALHNLFARRGQSFQGPVDAFREAFDDLKAHQIAMMAGMRAAFGALLARFDPAELQEAFDKGLKRGALLDVINKTKYWDLYREMYAELGNDDATFRRLFGDEFAQAYEEQMQRLAGARKRS